MASVTLVSCSAPSVWAPDAQVSRAFAPPVGDPALTLFTMKNVDSDNGAHTSLLINASQRIMFDPAGSFAVETIPERNDVLFGMTPRIEALYVSYHARETYYVVEQRLEVPAQVAERALRLALANGPVPKAGCTLATSRLLMQLPGFTSLRRTFFPDNLQEDFAELPGVETKVHRESDSDDKTVAAAQINDQIKAGLSE